MSTQGQIRRAVIAFAFVCSVLTTSAAAQSLQIVNAASFSGPSVAPGSIVSIFGGHFATGTSIVTDPAQYRAQSSNFWKNIGIMGGILLLWVTAGGRYALDRVLFRRA